jgi:hypothetical protein
MEAAGGLTGVLEAGGEGLALVPGHQQADPGEALGGPVDPVGHGQPAEEVAGDELTHGLGQLLGVGWRHLRASVWCLGPVVRTNAYRRLEVFA